MKGARGVEHARARSSDGLGGAMDLGLGGRTAIVGGASAGIGLGIAQALHREGVNLVMFSNEADKLERVAAHLGAAWVAGDQRHEADLERLVATAVRQFGTIDILVLNGGGPDAALATNVDDDALRDGAELILLPVIRLTRQCLVYLRENARGRVIAIVSTSVLEPIEDLALSNTFRPAVVGWLKTLAREVGSSGMTVNAIAPGRIKTRTFVEFYEQRSMEADLAEIPVGRFGEPGEVGDLVCFLASDRAAYLTGTVIPIDGGLTKRFV